MSEWIRASDTQPKADFPVLAFCRDEIDQSIWVAQWVGRGYGWRTIPGRWNLKSVTHWMPLPSPPA